MAKIIYINSGEDQIPITVEYRKVKNINLYIKPPEGDVLITAPRSVSMKRLLKFAEEKTDWITRKCEEVRKRSRIKAEKPPEPEITEEQMRHLERKLKEYICKWEPRMGVHAAQWTFRRMKTRWGSCTVDTAKIRINTRLALYHDECLEYIVVHELCHLIEPSHNQRFCAHMDQFLPDWRQRKERLRS